MAGRGVLYGEKRMNAGILVGKPEGKGLHEGLQRRWGDNVKIDLNYIGWQGVD
jgi:hypothetical protein